MKSFQLYKDIELTVRELQSNTSGLHKHHFFELIYVLEGAGIHNINENNYEFSKGSLFLLSPEDAHTFQIYTPTRFCVVDFTQSFFATRKGRQEDKMDVSELFKRLEYIFHNHHNVKGNIISRQDKDIVEMLMIRLIMEKENDQPFKEIIIQNIVFLLLHLIARNIQQNIADYYKHQNAKSSIHKITAYIQQNIYEKELIRVENIALHFNKSADHLSRYFKSQTGSTIKAFISRYKLELIQTRLKYSDLNISQIADELGFTDESHLNKTFKKAFGETASQYRKDCSQA